MPLRLQQCICEVASEIATRAFALVTRTRHSHFFGNGFMPLVLTMEKLKKIIKGTLCGSHNKFALTIRTF